MPRATLTLTVPEFVWIGELSRGLPEVQLRVLAAVRNGETGVALIELSASDPEAVLEEMRSYDSVATLEVLSDDAENRLVQLETTEPLLLEPIQQAGVPLEMPFTVEDGQVVWEVTASRSRLSMLAERLDDLGIPFRVDSIYQEVESEQLLTDHQWDVLRMAAEHGYYDTPRGCTQEELAEALGVAKSTCSETLHRAEEQIVKWFLETHDEAGADSDQVTQTA